MDMFGVFLTMMLEEKHGGEIDMEHASIMTTLIGNMLSMVADAIGKIHAKRPRAARDSTGGSDQPHLELPDDYDEYPAHDEWKEPPTKTTPDLEQEAITRQIEDDWSNERPPAPSEDSDPEFTELLEARQKAHDEDREWDMSAWCPSAGATRRGEEQLSIQIARFRANVA